MSIKKDIKYKKQTEQVLTDERSLSFRFPEIAKEWHPTMNGALTPQQVSYGKKLEVYWWKYNNGKPHSYYAKISYRLKRESGCAVCHGKQIAMILA